MAVRASIVRMMAEEDDPKVGTLGGSSKDSSLRTSGMFEDRICIAEQQRNYEARLPPQRNIQEIVADFEANKLAVAKAKAEKLAKMRKK